MPIINQPSILLCSRSEQGNHDPKLFKSFSRVKTYKLWVDMLIDELTSMLWLPMEFMVCLLLLLFQSDLESNTEVLEKKKRTLWGKVNNIIKLAVIFCSSSFFSSFPICLLFTLRFWHCILSAARSIWWQNAIWKNNETMSWRDIKLQWLASISCFPFNFQLCGL